MAKVLVTDSVSEKAVEILKKEGIEVDVVPTLEKSVLIEKIKDYEGLVVRSATKVTRDVISATQKMVVIGRAGAGLDNIDAEAASEKGIIVMNTPGGNTIAAAEHTIAMLLSLSRKIPQANYSMKNGKWEKNKFMGVEVLNKTIGVIGLGRIGTEVAKRALGMKMHVIAYDPFINQEGARKLGIELVELDEVFKRSDFITIHTPFSKETKALIGEKAFASMKNGVRIVNCARGGIVDENALYNAIVSGKVAGAALDVFEKEPPGENPLLGLEQVITTPHLGAATEEAQVSVAIEIAEQIADVLIRGIVRNAVNVPSVEPETLKELNPYLNLAEKMGSFLAQISDGRMLEVEINYAGEVTEYPVSPLTVNLLKGILNKILQDTVTDINAPFLAKQRGIKVVEMTSSQSEDYSSLITAKLVCDKGSFSVGGTLFIKKEPRIVRIDGFTLEAIPSGWMMVYSNIDVPGVVGKIGTIFGKNKINIAGMQLGRERPGGKAVSIINVDSFIPDSVMEEIRSLPDIVYAKLVNL